MQIEVRELTRRFGQTLAVNQVSFRFGAGNIFGFIGPNGAGKTTTIKIMSSIDLPDAGDVLYDGVSAVNDPEEIRRMVGYMPDALPDSLDIQVWEYLDFFARSFGIRGKARTRVLAEVEDFTGLGGIRYKYLATLSKGMRQRVSLARALVHDPDVLIMDEPAAGLDPRARLELRELLRILAGRKKAILLSSHILSELQDICDGAVIIERGRVLASGTLREIAQQEYRREALRRSGGDGGAIHLTVLRPGETAPAVPAVPAVPAEEDGLVVEIGFLDDGEAVRRKLLEHPAVRSVSLLGEASATVGVAGDERTVSQVMGTLFQAGLVITGFRLRGVDLEDIFMKITTGGVQ